MVDITSKEACVTAAEKVGYDFTATKKGALSYLWPGAPVF